MLFISLLVCIVGGALFGTVAWLALAVIAEKSLMPLISFPFVLIFAMPVAIPFGTVAALIATILFNILSRPSCRLSSKGMWIFTGSVAGVAVGSILPLFSTLIGFVREFPIGQGWADLSDSAVDLFSAGLVREKLNERETHNMRLETDLRTRSLRSRASSAQPLR